MSVLFLGENIALIREIRYEDSWTIDIYINRKIYASYKGKAEEFKDEQRYKEVLANLFEEASRNIREELNEERCNR